MLPILAQEEGAGQAGKRNSFEFDRPRKVLGRRSFDEAIDPPAGPNTSKSQRTGGDDEAWHSNGSSGGPAEVCEGRIVTKKKGKEKLLRRSLSFEL